MRLRRDARSRAKRAAALLLFLCGLPQAAGPADHADAPLGVLLRGEEAAPRDDWEGAIARSDEKAGANGGVSDGDDWLG